MDNNSRTLNVAKISNKNIDDFFSCYYEIYWMYEYICYWYMTSTSRTFMWNYTNRYEPTIDHISYQSIKWALTSSIELEKSKTRVDIFCLLGFFKRRIFLWTQHLISGVLRSDFNTTFVFLFTRIVQLWHHTCVLIVNISTFCIFFLKFFFHSDYSFLSLDILYNELLCRIGIIHTAFVIFYTKKKSLYQKVLNWVAESPSYESKSIAPYRL